MRKVGVANGIEITFLSDIPSEGSGLGSSSAVTVGVLHALYAYVGATPTAEQLARDACEIEIDILRKPVGVQDQYIAAYGGLRYFEFGPGPTVKTHPVKISRAALEDLDNQLMLFFTGKTRKADPILARQKSNFATQPDTLREMMRQAAAVRDLFEAGNVAALGPLLHRGWELKRQLTGGAATNHELDALYERAVTAGCLGGKIAGAGGGGFFLLCVPSERRAAVRQALAQLREMPFRLERGGSRVVLNMQRY
jgi:D-glycero-alpha-D-manno-heptose-7-phosphate kinase